MSSQRELSQSLQRLLDLEHPPIAITFEARAERDVPAMAPPQPAGCCFWAMAERDRVQTTAADHVNCSVGSYTHGLIGLADAACGEDTAALVASGWVTEGDLRAAPRIPTESDVITYEPLGLAASPDVVLLRLTPSSLMTLQGACPELSLVTKPQCQIVPLSYSGAVVASPGCAVSRVRTGLPAGELTCALPARDLPRIVERLERSVQADQAVTGYAAAELRTSFGHC